MKKYVLIWLCCLNSILTWAQSFKDFDVYLDKDNCVNYTRKGNKYAITVTIDGIKRTKYYPYVSPRKEGKYIPKFLMRYKKSYVFIMGTGFSYRCLTLFTRQNKTIAITDFENTIVDQAKDEKEYACFIYDSHPVVFNLNNLAEIRPIEVELSENVINIDVHSDFIELYFRKGPTKKIYFKNIFCDDYSSAYDVQPYTCNCKDLDLINGLNFYGYGARLLPWAYQKGTG